MMVHISLAGCFPLAEHAGMKNVLAVSGFVLFLVIGFLWWRDHHAMGQEAVQLRFEIERLRNNLSATEFAPATSAPLDEAAPAAPVAPVATPPVMVDVANSTPAPQPVENTTSQDRPPLSDEQVNAIERFDAAMDREFERLEARERAATDPQEVDMIQRIKEKLTMLDELYRRADTVTDPAERMQIQMQMQQEMGSIIGLTRRDRNERLGKLATDIGYSDPQAIDRVIQEIDRIYYETHMDWTKLFNRAPPP